MLRRCARAARSAACTSVLFDNTDKRTEGQGASPVTFRSFVCSKPLHGRARTAYLAVSFAQFHPSPHQVCSTG